MIDIVGSIPSLLLFFDLPLSLSSKPCQVLKAPAPELPSVQLSEQAKTSPGHPSPLVTLNFNSPADGWLQNKALSAGHLKQF